MATSLWAHHSHTLNRICGAFFEFYESAANQAIRNWYNRDKCAMQHGACYSFYLSILYDYTIISHNRSAAKKKHPKTTTTYKSNNFYRKPEITRIHTTYQRRMIKENCHRATKSNKFETKHGQHAQSPFGWHSVARIFCFESSHTNSL